MPTNTPLQRTWQRCADIARGRIAKFQASSVAVQGCATPLNADPLGGRRTRCRYLFPENLYVEVVEVTIVELGAIGEFVGSIAVLVTLIYLSVQIRQSSHLTRTQMGHSGWLATTAHEVALLGDDPAEALAKAELDEVPMSPRDIKILDAYFRSQLLQLGRVEHTNSLGLEIYTVEQTARAFIDLFNCRVGRAWWASNRALVELLAPTIGARMDELLSEPDCPSRSGSLKAFQRSLTS